MLNQIKLHRVVVGPLDTNCVIIEDTATKDAIIVDPGGDPDAITERVRLTGTRPVMIVLTHGHVDHCAESASIASMYGIPVAIHNDDLGLLDQLADQIEQFMGPVAAARFRASPHSRPQVILKDGDSVAFGQASGRVIHLPGHTMGGIGLYFEETPPVIIQGDTLFRDGFGRTDLWGGSWEALKKTLRDRLFTLPPETRVVCGHGGDTTIGREKAGQSF